jgi:hypothetical protein
VKRFQDADSKETRSPESRRGHKGILVLSQYLTRLTVNERN